MFHGARSLRVAFLTAVVVAALAQPAFPVPRAVLGELFDQSG
jgi:hypothetical protein